MSNHFGGIFPSDCCNRGSDLDIALGDGFRTTQDREGVVGKGPLACARPNAEGGGTFDDRRSLGDRGERRPVDSPDTVSICKGDIVGAEGSTGLRGGERRKVGGDTD